jgi:glycine/D-amino acid oxidase-like deaminating enzyme
MTQRHAIVIGAGIIGASIAWHLAKAGVAVTILDEGEPGGAATRRSWAWINATSGYTEPYFRLRQRSMALWRELDREVPGLTVNWCGGLIWETDESAALDAFASRQASWGYAIRRVERDEILALEPNLRTLPDHAYHVAEEGAVEPLAAAMALLAGAKGLGASVVRRDRVRWLLGDSETVSGVMTSDGPLHADDTIVAAGAGSVELLGSLGCTLRLTTPAGILAHSKPAPELLRGLVITPGLHVRQSPEGRLVAGTDFTGSDPESRADEIADGLMAGVQRLVAGAEKLMLDFHTTGYRPTPADGFPAVGRPGGRRGLYVAVSHSGVTLAPAIGRFAVEEILFGSRDPLIAPYHPDRPELA